MVDYVDGSLADSDARLVESHCRDCAGCADALVALREVPGLLCAEVAPSPELLMRQRKEILSAVEGLIRAESGRTDGFDFRILLPVAAALVIALAGLISLRPGWYPEDGVGLARAAFLFEMEDPQSAAAMSEILGVPLVLSERFWRGVVDADLSAPLAVGGMSLGSSSAHDDPSGDDSSDDDLSDDDFMEIEELLGMGFVG